MATLSFIKELWKNVVKTVPSRTHSEDADNQILFLNAPMAQSELKAYNYCIPKEDWGVKKNPLNLKRLQFWRKKMKWVETPSWLNMLSWKLKEDVKFTHRGNQYIYTQIMVFKLFSKRQSD